MTDTDTAREEHEPDEPHGADGLLPDDQLAVEIIPTDVEHEMSASFMSYALSVIGSRAIPDVRDGLKPVQRRILYTAHESRLDPKGPYSKSAKVVGATMGAYHPHGDASIYATLVRMSQPFSLRVPLMDGQGNFGSLDDGPAASRYTECRMAPAAIDMVEELTEDTVEFTPNYDGTTTEPVVLPSRLPNLLVNGTTGIAVGMATNIAPHHPAEVARAARALLADPDLDVAALMRHLPGPDFPGGGVIVDAGGLEEAYRTGRGSFKVRAKVEVARVSARRDGLVITELPPGVGPEAFISKVKELVSAGTIDSISDIADYSDRRQGLRVTIEVKAGRDPRQVLAELYQRTQLEETFSANHVVLDGFTPRTLGLKGLLGRWLAHREEVVERRTRFRLDKAERRAHLVEGLVKAMDALDEVIATIRSSKETATARTKLRKLLKIDDVQADHILEMQLRRLTRLEVTKLKDELKELRALIKDLRDILARPERRAAIIDTELADIEARYDEPRRSAIVDASTLDDPAPAPAGAKGGTGAAATIPDEPCLITVAADGTIARRPTDRTGRVTAADLAVVCVESTTTSPARLVTDTGRILRCDTFEIPPVDDKGRGGCAPTEVVDVEPGERVVGVLSPAAVADGQPAVLVTAAGVIKRVDATQLDPRQPAPIIGLRDGDRVVAAFCAPDDADAVIVTTDARVLRTPLGKVRPQGRSAGGVAGMRLNDGAAVLAAGPTHSADTMVATLSDGALVKVCPAVEYPQKGRGGGGVAERRMRRNESALVAAVVSDRAVTGVSAKGAPVAVPEPSGRNDAGAPAAKELVGVAVVAR